jgi:hypothetical protein
MTPHLALHDIVRDNFTFLQIAIGWGWREVTEGGMEYLDLCFYELSILLPRALCYYMAVTCNS